MSWRASWVLTSDGTAHLPTMQGPGLLLTGCRRSLPSWVPQYGPMQGQRRCPACFAALLLPSGFVIDPTTPAGRQLSDAPESAPGGQPVPAPPARCG
ncbi:MAG TPA: hypothetical protein VFW64_16150 [Pseudonocardiaceae bacterium]|nr:hypothetical protein [Pseudonocardiaceae bacterium]